MEPSISNSDSHIKLNDMEDNKAILNRMSRAIGHFESVKRMVENGENSNQVLIQLAAVKSAVNNIGKEVLKSHLNTCLDEASETSEYEAVEALNNSIDLFLK